MSGDVEVLDPGPLATVQDVAGRRDFRHLGVATAGAADLFSASLANLLVGNRRDVALIEIVGGGAGFRFAAPTIVGLAGADLGAVVDGQPIGVPAARRLPAGARLRFTGRRRGARGYLALAGGVEVDPVLGSRSTDLRSRFGGLGGRPLRAADRLRLGAPPGAQPGWLAPGLAEAAAAHVSAATPLAILPGPHLGRFAPDALRRLCAVRWRVSGQADRVGIRLDGPGIVHVGEREVPSLALPLGAVQVPPDGRPIVMLTDRPVTGGYPVIGCVSLAAAGRAAQLLPGDEVRFARMSAREARDELRAVEALLREGVRHDDDATAAWAGALD